MSIDYPLPRQMVLSRIIVQNPSNQPCSSWNSGQDRNRPICCHFTIRNLLSNFDHIFPEITSFLYWRIYFELTNQWHGLRVTWDTLRNNQFQQLSFRGNNNF